MLETCAVCGAEVPYSHSVHVMLNPGGEDGVIDHYVCRSCYEDELEPLFSVRRSTERVAEPGAETDVGGAHRDDPSDDAD